MELEEQLSGYTAAGRLEWLRAKIKAYAAVTSYRAGLLLGEAEVIAEMGNDEADIVKAGRLAAQAQGEIDTIDTLIKGISVAEWVGTGDVETELHVRPLLALLLHLSACDLDRKSIEVAVECADEDGKVRRDAPSDWLAELGELGGLAKALGTCQGRIDEVKFLAYEHRRDEEATEKLKQMQATAESHAEELKEGLAKHGY